MERYIDLVDIDFRPQSDDATTQSRIRMDDETVEEYAEAMQRGDDFPPVIVFDVGEAEQPFILADGYHRYLAAVGAGKNKIFAKIIKGNFRDALLYASGANATHGLRRTNDDKRLIVLRMLRDRVWGKWSDRQIGKACNVSRPLVATCRQTVADERARSLADDSDGDSVEGKPSDEMDSEDLNPQVAAVWELIPDMRLLIRRIKDLRTDIKDACEHSPAMAWIHLQQANTESLNLQKLLEFGIPHAQCPRCQGNKCSSCRQHGWLPKQQYERLR